jgi:hypothetical protein
MGYWTQFEDFDPLTGKVPYHPISYLPDIAWRARALLKSYTSKQISKLAENIYWAIDEYFLFVREQEIERLYSELHESRRFEYYDDESTYLNAQYFFIWEADWREGCGSWIFDERKEDELDIPTAGNTSEVDALKECLDYLEQIDDDDLINKQPYEYFAVLSLSLLAEVVNYLNPENVNKNAEIMLNELDTATRKLGIKTIAPNINLSCAGSSAIKAMDAVCYAEQLKEIERIQSSHSLELAKTHGDYASAQAKRQEEEISRRNERAKKLNEARHLKTNEAKDIVISEWKKQPTKFPSAEKAGLHFADYLATRGFDYTPRTVTSWIRAYAKQENIRLR